MIEEVKYGFYDMKLGTMHRIVQLLYTVSDHAMKVRIIHSTAGFEPTNSEAMLVSFKEFLAMGWTVEYIGRNEQIVKLLYETNR